MEKKANTYVISRSEEDKSLVLIKEKTAFEKENIIIESYKECFDLVILNNESALTVQEYKAALDTILPSLSLLFESICPEECAKLIDGYIESHPNGSMPEDMLAYDRSTIVFLIIMESLFKLKIDQEENKKVIKIDLIEALRSVFPSLPYYLVDLALNKYSSLVAKKTNNEIDPNSDHT